jgi:hypothetical protein
VAVWGIAFILLTVAWFQHRELNAAHSKCTVQSNSLDQMLDDARFINAALTTPQRAVDRERPHEELLALIENALHDAGIAQESWQDSVPQPPQVLAGGNYTRMGTRIYLEEVSLQSMTIFCHGLIVQDSSLRIHSLRLTAPRQNTEQVWNVEMTIVYLVVT